MSLANGPVSRAIKLELLPLYILVRFPSVACLTKKTDISNYRKGEFHTQVNILLLKILIFFKILNITNKFLLKNRARIVHSRSCKILVTK